MLTPYPKSTDSIPMAMPAFCSLLRNIFHC
jgi:hypothetical protein